MNRRHYVALAILLLLALVAGCAVGGGATGMRVEDKGGMSVETLVSNYQNYNVYYLGTEGRNITAVLFDPKEDGKSIKVEPRWEKATSQTSARQMVELVASQGGGANIPRLWKLLGPDGSVWGYVYTFAVQMAINMADGAMWVGYP